MSDLRLEDLRLVQCLPSCEIDHHRMVPTHHRPVSRAEVLQAALTEDCRRCDGAGGWDESDAWDDRTRDWVECPTCDGRGWLPINGGVALLAGGAYGLYEDDFLVVPLSMLEGDDT